MDRYSRARVIVCLFFATALAERMTDLDDIERDNLRAEGASRTESGRSKEASYGSTDKPMTSQSDHQQEPRRYHSEDRSSGYAGQDKYSLNGYERGSKYSENDVGYQEPAGPIQRYSEYDRQRQVVAAVPNGPSHASAYEPQQRLFYQPEVAVGNRYQTVLQKEATEKYAEIPNGEPVFFTIPMSQLLAYYPDLSVGQPTMTKNEGQPLLHRLATETARKIVIPVYAPAQSREPIYAHSKVAYRTQPQYLSSDPKYQHHTEAILPTKRPSKLIYAQNVLSHRRPHSQPDRYLQEIVYTQPGAIYTPELSPSHAEVYPPRPSVHLRGNGPGRSHAGQTRHRQQYASYTQPETYYALHSGNIASQLTDQLYQEQSADNALQNYDSIPEPPTSEHDLPRLPAQNFKSGASVQLVSVSNESEDSHYSQNHLDHSSEPRSLLDSYVPSQLIAAQDSERYRERPIRLERGFLPSKIDFVQSHKKRNAE